MISRETDPTHLKGSKRHLWVTYVDAFCFKLEMLLRKFSANDTNPVALNLCRI